MGGRWTWLAVGACGMCLTAVVSADTLVLRDGSRVEGNLVGVHDGVVEFEGHRGLFGGRERLRVDRADVLRIEFDEGDRDRDGARDGFREEPGGRPSGLRERDVRVESRTAWTDTGITVRAGQTIYVSATGRVRWGPKRQDDPAGEHGSPRNDARPLPGRPAAALIGRVGDGDEPFFIGGDAGPIRVRSSGRLFLGINDDFLEDNSGSFRVTVYY